MPEKYEWTTYRDEAEADAASQYYYHHDSGNRVTVATTPTASTTVPPSSPLFLTTTIVGYSAAVSASAVTLLSVLFWMSFGAFEAIRMIIQYSNVTRLNWNGETAAFMIAFSVLFTLGFASGGSSYVFDADKKSISVLRRTGCVLEALMVVAAVLRGPVLATLGFRLLWESLKALFF